MCRQCFERGAHDVDRIGRAVALRQHVVHTGPLRAAHASQPPAMTPVPSDAGCMYTFRCTVTPRDRSTRSCRDRSSTSIMLRRAASIAFWMATGTSRALPRPKPTRPLPSPTTVSAVKPKIRPPLTTLATRLDLDQLLEASLLFHFLRIRHGFSPPLLPVPSPKIPGRPRGRLRPAP